MLNSLGFYEVGTKVKINCPYLEDNLKDCLCTVIENIFISRNGEKIHYDIVDIPDINNNIVVEQKYLTAKPDINTEENIILTGLYNLGYRYIAMDENYDISAFNYAPSKSINDEWDVYCVDRHNMKVTSVPMLNNYLSSLCKCEDKTATSIAWLLGKPE